MGFVGGAEIADEEVWEDSPGGVERGGGRLVLRIPFVFTPGEGFRGVFVAQGEVAFCVVGFRLCSHC